MKKLKIILQYNYLFYILFIISIALMLIRTNITPATIYNDNYKEEYGYIYDYKLSDDKITLYIKAKEKLAINYSYKNKKEIDNLSYGDYIKIEGKFIKPTDNTNFNLFNYRKYLLSKNIKYTVKADKITLIKKNNNILYKIKVYLLKRIDKLKTSNYIKTFIFADKNYIDEDNIANYQKLGISHLLAVSGMHVSLVSLLLLKLLSFLSENKRYFIISIVLLIYLFLTNFTISMIRAVLQFILFFINKLLKLNIKSSNIVILLFSILLIYNPYYIYNIGFIFSFTISYTLITFNYLIKGNFIKKSLLVSTISFLSSLPIVINNFYQINILSILFNLFYVPFISYIIFPLSILTLIFPTLDKLNYFFINIFERISLFLSNINIFTFNIAKLPILFIVIYYIFLYMLFKKMNIKNVFNIIFILIVFIFYNSFLFIPKVVFIDVGQGDATLIRMHNKNILIDTGGLINSNYNITKNILLPLLKSDGVKKIDYLIITHGDYDHTGEAINLVNNFKVEKVIFNCGSHNNLEQELIKVLDKKKIKYYSCIKELNIDKNKLYFLQTRVYDNENDNSNVIYTELNGYKFLFMGDASSTTEREILGKYNLLDIDVLKVGHHGSKTSSSKEFISEINPKYSIISVGKNNRYGHPNKEALNNLEDSKIYRTDEDGSIMFKIRNNKLRIDTCSP